MGRLLATLNRPGYRVALCLSCGHGIPLLGWVTQLVTPTGWAWGSWGICDCAVRSGDPPMRVTLSRARTSG